MLHPGDEPVGSEAGNSGGVEIDRGCFVAGQGRPVGDLLAADGLDAAAGGAAARGCGLPGQRIGVVEQMPHHRGARVAQGAQFLQGCPKSSRSPWFSVAVSTPPLDWSTRGAGCSCS